MTKPATTAALYVNGTFTAYVEQDPGCPTTAADLERWRAEHIARGHDAEIRHLSPFKLTAELCALETEVAHRLAARAERDAAEWGWAR
ncbi:hypothetical protein CMI37_04670 [Candidatus Pacearchaeota archaeon]|nr:hypothetical protein [Candidatus Pacearchaeota archaeon]